MTTVSPRGVTADVTLKGLAYYENHSEPIPVNAGWSLEPENPRNRDAIAVLVNRSKEGYLAVEESSMLARLSKASSITMELVGTRKSQTYRWQILRATFTIVPGNADDIATQLAQLATALRSAK
eukprot:jgi/Mesvir1/19608/Mv25169-RA.1